MTDPATPYRRAWGEHGSGQEEGRPRVSMDDQGLDVATDKATLVVWALAAKREARPRLGAPAGEV